MKSGDGKVQSRITKYTHHVTGGIRIGPPRLCKFGRHIIHWDDVGMLKLAAHFRLMTER